MNELVLETKTLPEPLTRLIRAKKVKVRKEHGEIRLTPIPIKKTICPFLGMFADVENLVDEFMANKRFEKELEE